MQRLYDVYIRKHRKSENENKAKLKKLVYNEILDTLQSKRPYICIVRFKLVEAAKIAKAQGEAFLPTVLCVLANTGRVDNIVQDVREFKEFSTSNTWKGFKNG